jgi:hypothetical protein
VSFQTETERHDETQEAFEKIKTFITKETMHEWKIEDTFFVLLTGAQISRGGLREQDRLKNINEVQNQLKYLAETNPEMLSAFSQFSAETFTLIQGLISTGEEQYTIDQALTELDTIEFR